MFSMESYILLILMVFSVSACDFSSDSEVGAVNTHAINQIQSASKKDQSSETANASDQAVSAGICSNKYFPVADGAKRRYKVTSSKGSDEYTYTVSYRAGTDRFTQIQDIIRGSATELKIDWLCFPDGLRTAKYGQLTGNPNTGMNLDSKGGTGITLPKESDWQVGKKWISEYELGGTFEMKPIKGVVAGKAALNHEILNMEEKVKVSAGEFTAAKVRTVISLQVSFQKRRLPPESVVVTNWYAPGVGMVKQEVTGAMGKMTMDYLGK